MNIFTYFIKFELVLIPCMFVCDCMKMYSRMPSFKGHVAKALSGDL